MANIVSQAHENKSRKSTYRALHNTCSNYTPYKINKNVESHNQVSSSSSSATAAFFIHFIAVQRCLSEFFSLLLSPSNSLKFSFLIFLSLSFFFALSFFYNACGLNLNCNNTNNVCVIHNIFLFSPCL